ncbi:ribonuclease E/G [Qipengyuania sp. 6B39]|uniref:ribonuclease E/G n=1 Tax=Qipengyuania proteolytica TaxID=2867239 RepID=UPI001C89B839|nr:ribonuclease E/G [Qipengyuania proteolytica]MBX7495541.1 ribonuclease E/G [Qipengyuania proteolytica]
MPDAGPEWLVEQGIGEQRALLVDKGEVLAAKLRWPGDLPAGKVLRATLVHRTMSSDRGTAQLGDGTQILIDNIPPEFSEGMEINVQVKRDAISERGRFKRAQGRLVEVGLHGGTRTDRPRDAFETGRVVRRFPSGLWEDVWVSAATREIAFENGSLLFDVTPAMTVVDVDGTLTPIRLAHASIEPLVRGLDLFDIGGQVVIDFPTLGDKVPRKEFDQALQKALGKRPMERTAINGFGLVQLVSRLEGPSLLHRFATSRVGMAARMALRRAEMVEGPGVTLLTVHPAVKAKLKPDWLAELERRTARPVRVETDPGLAIEAAQAQIVPHD